MVLALPGQKLSGRHQIIDDDIQKSSGYVFRSYHVIVIAPAQMRNDVGLTSIVNFERRACRAEH